MANISLIDKLFHTSKFILIVIACVLQDVDNATSSRITMEKKLEQLEVELEFLKRINQQVRAVFL